MACLFLDSFDHYETANIEQKWNTSNASIVSSVFRTGGQSLFCDNAQHAWLTIDNALHKTMICGSAVLVRTLGGILMGFSRAQSTPLDECYVGIGLGGILQFVVPFGPTVIIYNAPADTALHVETWYRVELKVKIERDDTGSVEVRLNGVTVIQATNVRTGSVGSEDVTTFGLTGAGGGGETFHDDVYLCDSTGSFNNDFMGDIRVFETTPSEDGHYTEWTPSSGVTHFDLVNEIPPDTSSYVSSGTNGQRDTYVFPFPDATPPLTVPARQALFLAEKDAGGNITYAPLLRQGGVDHLSSDDVAPSLNSYLYGREVFDINPVTGLPWTSADLVACEMGQQITS